MNFQEFYQIFLTIFVSHQIWGPKCLKILFLYKDCQSKYLQGFMTTQTSMTDSYLKKLSLNCKTVFYNLCWHQQKSGNNFKHIQSIAVVILGDKDFSTCPANWDWWQTLSPSPKKKLFSLKITIYTIYIISLLHSNEAVVLFCLIFCTSSLFVIPRTTVKFKSCPNLHLVRLVNPDWLT